MAVDLGVLKNRLQEERQRLGLELCQLSALQSFGEGIRQEDSGYGTHMADDAPETYEKEQRLSLELNLRNLLEDIERALHRMDIGTYGVCESCRLPIEEGRLEALPHANFCLECTERHSKHKPA